MTPRRFGSGLRVGGIDEGKARQRRGHGGDSAALQKVSSGNCQNENSLLLAVDEQFSTSPGPQAPIIEDPLYGKVSADYVAFSSSCQSTLEADAAKGPGNKRAIS
jgi:hypothetical protein